MRNKIYAKYKVVPSPADGGKEDTDYPYFHVTNHPEKPTLREKTARGPNYNHPIGIYLFPKGKRVGVEEWADKKYRWDAKIKPGLKILDLADANDDIIDMGDKVKISLRGSDNWFKELANKVHDSKRLTELFQEFGYEGILDLEGRTIYKGEPQLIIFNPDNIIWLKQEENKMGEWDTEEQKIYNLRGWRRR